MIDGIKSVKGGHVCNWTHPLGTALCHVWSPLLPKEELHSSSTLLQEAMKLAIPMFVII